MRDVPYRTTEGMENKCANLMKTDLAPWTLQKAIGRLPLLFVSLRYFADSGTNWLRSGNAYREPVR